MQCRELHESEQAILRLIQQHYGPQNSADRVSITVDGAAVTHVRDREERPIVMADLTALARMRADGSIATERELLLDWLCVADTESATSHRPGTFRWPKPLRSPMSPPQILDRFVELLPEFRAYWDAPGNLFRDDDGHFSHHGVCVMLSWYVRERHATISADTFAALGRFVSDCVRDVDDELGNALSTCFLENISGEACGRELSPHLTGAARKVWEFWASADQGLA